MDKYPVEYVICRNSFGISLTEFEVFRNFVYCNACKWDIDNPNADQLNPYR